MLQDTSEKGEIHGITGVTIDAVTAAIWQTESPLYVAEEFGRTFAAKQRSEELLATARCECNLG